MQLANFRRLEIMGAAVQLIAWFFSVGCWGATLGVVLSKKWRKNTLDGTHGTVLDSVTNVEGLWVTCQTYPTGQTQCWGTDWGEVPGVILFCRLSFVLSIILSFVGGASCLGGFSFTLIGPRAVNQKRRLLFACSVVFLLSAISVTLSSSWFIYDTMTSPPFVDPKGNPVRFAVDEAPQISAAFGIIWILSALTLLCSSRHRDDDVTYAEQTGKVYV